MEKNFLAKVFEAHKIKGKLHLIHLSRYHRELLKKMTSRWIQLKVKIIYHLKHRLSLLNQDLAFIPREEIKRIKSSKVGVTSSATKYLSMPNQISIQYLLNRSKSHL